MRKHWHNASERNPHREALLLYFASGPGTPGSTPDPTATPITYGGPELSPEGFSVVPEGHTPAPPSAAEAVSADRENTRDAIAETLDASSLPSVEVQDEKLSPSEVAEGFEAMVKHLDAIREYRKDNKLTDMLRTLPPVEQEESYKTLHLIESQHGVASELHDVAASLAEWKEGALKPETFRATLERGFAQHPNIQHILASFDAEANSPRLAPLISQWNKDGDLAQQSQKIEVTDGIWRAIDGDKLIEELQTYLDQWAEHTKKIEELIRPSEVPASQDPAGKQSISLMDRIRGIRRNGIAGIGFYSPLEWSEAIKKIYQAFQNARAEDLDLMSNKLAVHITGALEELHSPYGQAVNRRFNSTAEADFNKKKNEFKEELGDDDFKVLVSKFHAVRNDPPRAIAVLEVAAGHGWIYDIADLTDQQWPVYIFGEEFTTLTPSHWNEAQVKNYMGTLTRQNTEGSSKEQENGKNRIIKQQNVNVYKDKFKGYLESHNYWAAFGVADAFIGRGKLQEVDTYLTLTLLEHLRTYPDARKYLTPSVIEQFAVLRWGQATASMNNIAFQMEYVKKLHKDPQIMEGYLLSTIDAIYKDLEAADPSLKTNENKNRKIEIAAQIMAGQTVQVNGQPFSLFIEKYRPYWDDDKNANTYLNDLRGEEVFQTEGDYLSPYGASSLVLVSTKTASSILKTETTGQFKNSSLAAAYLQRVTTKADELDAGNNTEAANTFRELMKERLSVALRSTFNERAPGQIIRVQMDNGEYILGALVKRNLVDRSHILALAGPRYPEGFVEELDRQINEPKKATVAKKAKDTKPGGAPGQMGRRAA